MILNEIGKINLVETKPGMDDFYVRDCIPEEEVDNSCDTHEGAEEGVVV